MRKKTLLPSLFLIIMRKTIEDDVMRKVVIFLLVPLLLIVCCKKKKEHIYTIGVFQGNEAPHLNEARQGFARAFEDNGLVNGVNVQLITRNGRGNIAEVQKIAQEFAREKVEMICALSTP